MIASSSSRRTSCSLGLSGVLTCIITSCLVGTAASPAYGVPLASKVQQLTTSSFVYPLMGTRTSSDFGTRRHPLRKKMKHHHKGIDLAAPTGATIRSIATGRVIYADPFGGYGNFIVIKHDNGLTSHYGHCQETSVRVGQKVHAGDVIGTVGSTGHSTGPHLHFEIRYNGEPQHPERYLPGLALPAEG
jgi:murein DD-endopeptidase MepM/ murein hydrolase activator NlpD